MKCLTADKLSQYVDDLLVEREHLEIDNHVKICTECKRVVEAFRGEQEFLKETLRTPSLPDNFATLVLDKLEPYDQKPMPVSRKWKPWKRIMVAVAGIALAFGITATLNPSFAEWISGLFSTEQVDEGLRMAADVGLAQRVNQEVTDKGLTLKVEDVVADSSRVAISYQVFNSAGKLKDIQLDFIDHKNKISVIDQNGKTLEISSMGWSGSSDYDYGFVELSLREHENLEKVTVKFNLSKLNGIEGNWDMEIHVDLNESLKLTTVLPLTDAQTSVNGVELQMKEARFTPSTNEILYETGFTKEELEKMESEMKKLKERFGNERIGDSMHYGTAIGYSLVGENGKPIAHSNSFLEGQGHPSDEGLLEGSGRELEQTGSFAWNESFIPGKPGQKLTFILNGVFKTVPSDFSLTIKPKELKKEPVSFEYEGNYFTIQKAKLNNEYSLQKSLNPIEKETEFIIEMEGSREATATQLGSWIVVDGTGKVFEHYGGGSILDEKDKNGRYKTTIDLRIKDMDEIPEELTLHLVSVTRYTELKDKWKLPLY